MLSAPRTFQADQRNAYPSCHACCVTSRARPLPAPKFPWLVQITSVGRYRLWNSSILILRSIRRNLQLCVTATTGLKLFALASAHPMLAK